MQSAGGVDNGVIVAVGFGVLHAFLCDIHGISMPALENFRARFFPDDLQLGDRGGTLHVARDEQGFLVLLFKVKGEFAAKRSFARALKSAHHDDSRRV